MKATWLGFEEMQLHYTPNVVRTGKYRDGNQDNPDSPEKRSGVERWKVGNENTECRSGTGGRELGG